MATLNFGKMSIEELKAFAQAQADKAAAETAAREAAEAERDEAKAAAAAKAAGVLFYKVSAKGALSCYGINARFPITMYLAQQERYDADIENRKAFIAKHRSLFSVKPPKA